MLSKAAMNTSPTVKRNSHNLRCACEGTARRQQWEFHVAVHLRFMSWYVAAAQSFAGSWRLLASGAKHVCWNIRSATGGRHCRQI